MSLECLPSCKQNFRYTYLPTYLPLSCFIADEKEHESSRPREALEWVTVRTSIPCDCRVVVEVNVRLRHACNLSGQTRARDFRGYDGKSKPSKPFALLIETGTPTTKKLDIFINCVNYYFFAQSSNMSTDVGDAVEGVL